jgi:hypothetical protein
MDSGRVAGEPARQIDAGDRATAGSGMLRNLSAQTAEAVDSEDQGGGWRRPQSVT